MKVIFKYFKTLSSDSEFKKGDRAIFKDGDSWRLCTVRMVRGNTIFIKTDNTEEYKIGKDEDGLYRISNATKVIDHEWDDSVHNSLALKMIKAFKAGKTEEIVDNTKYIPSWIKIKQKNSNTFNEDVAKDCKNDIIEVLIEHDYQKVPRSTSYKPHNEKLGRWGRTMSIIGDFNFLVFNKIFANDGSFEFSYPNKSGSFDRTMILGKIHKNGTVEFLC